jgi:septal ring factor EnvC (AmiA/AmiB activator)
MPTEDMQAAIRENAQAIAEVKARVDGHDEDLARVDRHIAKLDEAVVMLREGMARVATKEDIGELRQDISKTFFEQLKDAHNSIPTKTATWFGGLMAAIALVDLALRHFHG